MLAERAQHYDVHHKEGAVPGDEWSFDTTLRSGAFKRDLTCPEAPVTRNLGLSGTWLGV